MNYDAKNNSIVV